MTSLDRNFWPTFVDLPKDSPTQQSIEKLLKLAGITIISTPSSSAYNHIVAAPKSPKDFISKDLKAIVPLVPGCRAGKILLTSASAYHGCETGTTLISRLSAYRTLFDRLVVCCTGIKQEEKAVIEAFVMSLGGNFARDFTTNVTHLVAIQTTSDKYKAAVRLTAEGKNNFSCALVKPDWVWASFATGSQMSTDNFAVPALAGLRFSVTGLEPALRTQVQQLAQQNGGTYTPHLEKECTHLIAKEAKGEKYVHAVQWGIPVVTIKWLQDSVKNKGVVEEHEYQVDGTEHDGDVAMTDAKSDGSGAGKLKAGTGAGSGSVHSAASRPAPHSPSASAATNAIPATAASAAASGSASAPASAAATAPAAPGSVQAAVAAAIAAGEHPRSGSDLGLPSFDRPPLETLPFGFSGPTHSVLERQLAQQRLQQQPSASSERKSVTPNKPVAMEEDDNVASASASASAAASSAARAQLPSYPGIPDFRAGAGAGAGSGAGLAAPSGGAAGGRQRTTTPTFGKRAASPMNQTDGDPILFDPQNNSYLDACIVSIVGFDEPKLSRAVNIVVRGGGTRCLEIRRHATHCVAPSYEIAKEAEKLDRTQPIECPIVGIEWLVDCYRNKSQMPTDDYLLAPSASGSAFAAEDSAMASRSGLKRNASIGSGSKADGGNSDQTNFAAFYQKLASDKEKGPKKIAPSPSAAELLAVPPAGTPQTSAGAALSRSLSARMTPAAAPAGAAGAAAGAGAGAGAAAAVPTETPVFHRLRFVEHELPFAKIIEIHGSVKNAGGTIIRKHEFKKDDPESRVDYILCDQHSEDVATLYGVNAVPVNMLWIAACLREKQFIDPTGNLMYSPAPMPRHDVFQSLVVCVSLFEGKERTALKEIVEAVGGKFTEHFNRSSGIL